MSNRNNNNEGKEELSSGGGSNKNTKNQQQHSHSLFGMLQPIQEENHRNTAPIENNTVD